MAIDTLVPYRGSLRLFVERKPWKLILTMKGVALSPKEIVAELDRRTLEREFNPEDIDELFRVGSKFDVQIEPDDETVPTPVVRSKLTTRVGSVAAIQISFAIEEPNADIDFIYEHLLGEG